MTSAQAYRLALSGIMLAVGIGPTAAENFDAGKTGAQLFAANCSSCHHTPRGLAKGRFSWTLTNFLSEHYTADETSARLLSSYLLSVGGTAKPASHRAQPRRPARSATSELSPRPPANVPRR